MKSLIRENDYVRKSDGTLIAYDVLEEKFYKVQMTEVKPSELDDKDILALMKKFTYLRRINEGPADLG